MIFAGEHSHSDWAGAPVGLDRSTPDALNVGRRNWMREARIIFIRTLGVDLKTPDRSLCLVG